MSHYAIITDTDASLPDDLAAKYEIEQVPMSVHFGSETFLSNYEIDDRRVFQRIDQEKRLPTTSAPNPGQFASAYRRAFERGAEGIICICVSSQVSGTYNAAMMACEDFPGRDVTVVDSKSLSLCQGFMALAAVEAARSGASKEAILKQAEDVGRRSVFYAALATLKYLAMSGRVGHLTAGIGGVLSIKPILTIRDGKLEMLERVRTRRKAWDKVLELTEKSLGGKPAERMGVIHVDAEDEAKEFLELLRQKGLCPADVLIAQLTPGLSVHGGAGLVGVTAVASAGQR